MSFEQSLRAQNTVIKEHKEKRRKRKEEQKEKKKVKKKQLCHLSRVCVHRTQS